MNANTQKALQELKEQRIRRINDDVLHVTSTESLDRDASDSPQKRKQILLEERIQEVKNVRKFKQEVQQQNYL